MQHAVESKCWYAQNVRMAERYQVVKASGTRVFQSGSLGALGTVLWGGGGGAQQEMQRVCCTLSKCQ